MEEPLFADRVDAGRQLANVLTMYAGSLAAVIGLARGGIVVGWATAGALRLPLGALVVRKVGAPQNSELALGAVSETGERWIDWEICATVHADDAYVAAETARQVEEARRRRETYGTATAAGLVRDRTAIVVDDGIATGATALVALRSVRGLGARALVLATPVASTPAVRLLRSETEHLVVLHTPSPFLAVGLYYADFSQVSDEDVLRHLHGPGARLGG